MSTPPTRSHLSGPRLWIEFNRCLCSHTILGRLLHWGGLGDRTGQESAQDQPDQAGARGEDARQGDRQTVYPQNARLQFFAHGPIYSHLENGRRDHVVHVQPVQIAQRDLVERWSCVRDQPVLLPEKGRQGWEALQGDVSGGWVSHLNFRWFELTELHTLFTCRSNLNYLELGLPVKMIRTIAAYKYIGAVKNSNFIFTTLEEYVNDGRTFDSVTFENYDHLFRSYVLFGLLLLLLAKRRWVWQLLITLIGSIWPMTRQWKTPRNRMSEDEPPSGLQL